MQKFRGCLKVVAGLVILTLVLVIGIGIGLGADDPPDTPTPATVASATAPVPSAKPQRVGPAATPTPTATPVPTATPMPTTVPTPVATQPTRVAALPSVPTPTPVPTVAPECPTSAELDYMIELAALMGNISTSNLEIATLLKPVKANPEVLGTPSFRETFVVHAAVVLANADQVVRMQPAPTRRLWALGATAELMARYFTTGLEQMANGIDAQDLAQLGEGVSMAQLATRTLASAQELAGRVCE